MTTLLTNVTTTVRTLILDSRIMLDTLTTVVTLWTLDLRVRHN